MRNNFCIINGEWNSIVPFKVDRIIDSSVGLEVFISGSGNNSTSGVFTFETYYGYRNFDEGDLWRRWSEVGVLYSGLYMAKQSDFLDWAADQSVYGVLPDSLANYLLVSTGDVLDVLSDDAPRFDFVE